MTINKINGLTNAHFKHNLGHEKKINNKIHDSVNISNNAKMAKAIQDKGIGELRNSEVVRKEKVEQAKLNLEKYFVNGKLTQEVSEKLAAKIADSLLV